MLTHLEPIGRQKYQLRGQRAAPYLMERFILVLFLMCANVWIITSSQSKNKQQQMDICNTHIRWGTKPLNTVFRKNSVLSGWEFFFSPCFVLKSWLGREWFEEKCRGTALAFSGELCAWHFSQLLLVSASKYDVHVSSAEAALHYILLARWKGHLENKHCLVCHSHTPTHSVSPLWAPSDSVTAIVPPLYKAPCVSKLPGEILY